MGLFLCKELIDISTHSLTRRLTTFADVPDRIKDISTHSLTRRLTAKLMGKNHVTIRFQLTASQGG